MFLNKNKSCETIAFKQKKVGDLLSVDRLQLWITATVHLKPALAQGHSGERSNATSTRRKTVLEDKLGGTRNFSKSHI